jgi:hypothetical protein
MAFAHRIGKPIIVNVKRIIEIDSACHLAKSAYGTRKNGTGGMADGGSD